jgi:hypothetical protein
MNKRRILSLIARGGLFALILCLGTIVALMAGETEGLAVADLSGASVQAATTTAQGDVVYVSTTGGPQPTGVYRSDDNGYAWHFVSPGPDAAVTALAVHPADQTVLYAGTGGGPADTTDNLWFSIDGGQSWHKFLLSLPASPEGMILSVTTLAVDPNQPGVLYVGTDGHGLYRFEMQRDSFGYELIGGVSLYTAHVNGLVVGPEGQVYALTNDGPFVTDGDAWQKLSPPEQGVVSLAVAPDDPKRLYVGCVSTGLYHSIDGGQTWERVNNGVDMIPGIALRVTALAMDESSPWRVVAAIAYGVGSQLVPEGVYESTDAGDSWTKVAEADGLVSQLIVNQGIILSVMGNGLARYGKQVETGSVILSRALSLLTHPTVRQVLILILTVGLAGLILGGRVEWLRAQRHARA